MVNAITKYARQYAASVALLIGIAVLAAITGGNVDAMQQTVNDAFGGIVAAMAKVLFWAPFLEIPLVVIVLIGGAIFFTIRFLFINVRGFWHATEIVRGKYDDPDDPGEVSHFQALSSALSATVGLGNIAGVAIAVAVGGPGAVFWMMVAATFGMTSKFAECTLGQMYRQVDESGEVRGGPMVYLREGLAEMGWPKLGKVLSVVFAVLCIGGSFGGGNMFQANQSFQAMASLVPAMGGEKATGVVRLHSPEPVELEYKKHMVKFERPANEAEGFQNIGYRPTTALKVSAEDWTQGDGEYVLELEAVASGPGTDFNVDKGKVTAVSFATVDEKRNVNWTTPEGMTVENIEKFRGGSGHFGWLYGLLLAVLVGIVIVGGIKRIGNVADKIVPAMCVLYVISGIAVLIIHASDVPGAVETIVRTAFTDNALYGGFIGVLVQGVRRAAFSNEAGVGSAAIAHSAARTKYPVREGLVALLEPFIDTIVICFMTGIVIVVTGVYADPATAGLDGVLLTGAAFGEALSDVAQYLLSAAVVLFAFSTMISWSYYGERCWSYLFGPEQTFPYRILFCFFVWLGCVASLGNVLDFSDLMILSMAFPNIVGVIILSGKVKRALDDYWGRYRGGEFDD
jgi:Na+/alanine symporter